MKKLSLSLAAAVALGLCTAPAAHANLCFSDPVYDPGQTGSCGFALAPALPGGEATIKGKYADRSPFIDPKQSYLKDTADDGMDAYLWVRYTNGMQTNEMWLARASGAGATAMVEWSSATADSFAVRVCLGPDTGTCSDWRS